MFPESYSQAYPFKSKMAKAHKGENPREDREPELAETVIVYKKQITSLIIPCFTENSYTIVNTFLTGGNRPNLLLLRIRQASNDQ